jgi:outer membrane protein OmpA-like peptidoglycan-associated protein
MRHIPAGAARVRAVLAIAVAAALPNTASAQRAPAFAGAEVRGGLVFPEAADVGLGLMGEVDLGYVWRPELRAIVGISRLTADIDRLPGDDEGSFTATGLWLGARYDLFALGSTAPYLRGALTIQRVSADAWDTDVDALLSGTNAGAALALGVRRNLDVTGRFGGTVEVRRTWLNNLAHTALELGIRWQQRGTSAYQAEPVIVAVARPLGEPAREPAAPAPDRPRAAPPTPAQPELAREMQPAPDQPTQVAPAAADDVVRARIAEERAAAAEAVLRQGLNRAAVSMRSAAGVRETGDAFIVTLSGVAFASGAGSLSPAARSELRVLATVLAGYPGHIIHIDGHTDAVGDPAANQTLSEERAAAVRAALIAEGVDPLWSAARAFGAARPVASNETAAGRAANRRVEIHVMKRRCTDPPRPGTDGALACPTVAG